MTTPTTKEIVEALNSAAIVVYGALPEDATKLRALASRLADCVVVPREPQADAFGYDMPPRDRRIREFAIEFGCVQFWDSEYQSLVCAHRGGTIEPIRDWNEVKHVPECEGVKGG